MAQKNEAEQWSMVGRPYGGKDRLVRAKSLHELYVTKSVTNTVTASVTTRVTASVTTNVTKSVTNTVTASVTTRVTTTVTTGVTINVTRDPPSLAASLGASC